MGGFEVLDHTADLRLVAHGKDLPDALAWIATGMFSVIADLDAVATRDAMRVSITSTDREALVVDWLNELLFRYETEGFLPRCFEVTVNDAGTALEARCAGEPADPARHRTSPLEKAATYHALEVKHGREWRIQVVLDV